MGALAEDTKRFEAAERALNEWGDACRQTSQELGVPTISNISETIQHVQRQERRQKSERKKRLRKERERRRKMDLPPLDPKEIAEIHGYVDQELTAAGKQTRLVKDIRQTLDSRILTIDRIITTLPKWQRTCIFRSYMYKQPDRVAALELRMPPGWYANRRRCAVYEVANRLDERYIRRACK